MNDNLKFLDNYLYLYFLMKKKLNFDMFIKLADCIMTSTVSKDNNNFTKNKYVELIEFDDKFLNYIFNDKNGNGNVNINGDVYVDVDNNYYGSRFVVYHIYKNAFFLEIIKHANNNKILTEKHILLIIKLSRNKKLCKNTEEIVNFLYEIGCDFTENIYCAIYSTNDCNAINIILNQKINITSKIFKSLFTRGERYEYYDTANAINCINMSINFGYVLTKEDFILMVQHNIDPEKNMIDKKLYEDKEFIESISNAVHAINMFPNNFDIKPSNFALVTLVKNNAKLGDIKQFIKDNKLTPTIECLREACKHKSYNAVIKYFVETHNLKPDDECMQNAVNLMYNSQLSYVYKHHKI